MGVVCETSVSDPLSQYWLLPCLEELLMSSNEPLETSIPEGPGVIPDRALFPLLLDEGSPLVVELE